MTWKVSLDCSRAEVAAAQADPLGFAELDPPPVLVTSESEGGRWRIEAYFEAKPTAALIAQLGRLAPAGRPRAERLAERDWVALSQEGLAPVQAGRFFVHTPRDQEAVPESTIALEIEAGLAFGTGRHETTRGCLLALDALKRRGAVFAHVADIGSGSGLLAFAALRLWPAARVIASDLDPIAVSVAASNAAANRIAIGRGPGRIELVVAAGMAHRRLAALAPFDLVIANILAGPLIDLTSEFEAALAPRGRLVLAGLLARQAPAVLSAYRRHGFAPDFRRDEDEWPTLVLRKR